MMVFIPSVEFQRLAESTPRWIEAVLVTYNEPTSYEHTSCVVIVSFNLTTSAYCTLINT